MAGCFSEVYIRSDQYKCKCDFKLSTRMNYIPWLSRQLPANSLHGSCSKEWYLVWIGQELAHTETKLSFILFHLTTNIFIL